MVPLESGCTDRKTVIDWMSNFVTSEDLADGTQHAQAGASCPGFLCVVPSTDSSWRVDVILDCLPASAAFVEELGNTPLVLILCFVCQASSAAVLPAHAQPCCATAGRNPKCTAEMAPGLK